MTARDWLRDCVAFVLLVLIIVTIGLTIGTVIYRDAHADAEPTPVGVVGDAAYMEPDGTLVVWSPSESTDPLGPRPETPWYGYAVLGVLVAASCGVLLWNYVRERER